MPRRILAALSLAIGTAAFAVDGDVSSTVDYGSRTRMKVVKLCDGNHEATDCNPLDLNDAEYGLPTHLSASLTRTTGCAAPPTAEVRGLDDSIGMPFLYASLTAAGTSSVTVSPVRHRWIDVDLSTQNGCTDLEVSLRLFYPFEDLQE